MGPEESQTAPRGKIKVPGEAGLSSSYRNLYLVAREVRTRQELGLSGPGNGQEAQSGCSNDRFAGSEASWQKLPPHLGQTMAGNPAGSVGGKASTTIS